MFRSLGLASVRRRSFAVACKRGGGGGADRPGRRFPNASEGAAFRRVLVVWKPNYRGTRGYDLYLQDEGDEVARSLARRERGSSEFFGAKRCLDRPRIMRVLFQYWDNCNDCNRAEIRRSQGEVRTSFAM